MTLLLSRAFAPKETKKGKGERPGGSGWEELEAGQGSMKPQKGKGAGQGEEQREGGREERVRDLRAARIRTGSQQNLRFRFVNNLSPLQLFLPINRK